MSRDKEKKTTKELTLTRERCLNPHADRVRCNLFHAASFFDSRDLVQVKYEMLRKVEREGIPISQAAADFGMSRPSFYQAKEDFETGGIQGLSGRKRGPKGAHKVTDEVLTFIETALGDNVNLKASDLGNLVHDCFGIRVHPRSIERALDRKKKTAASAQQKA